MRARVHLQTLWLQLLAAGFLICLNLPRSEYARVSTEHYDQICKADLQGWPIIHSWSVPGTENSNISWWKVFLNGFFLVGIMWLIRLFNEQRLNPTANSSKSYSKKWRIAYLLIMCLMFTILLGLRLISFKDYKPVTHGVPSGYERRELPLFSYDDVTLLRLASLEGRQILAPAETYEKAWAIANVAAKRDFSVIPKEGSHALWIFDAIDGQDE